LVAMIIIPQRAQGTNSTRNIMKKLKCGIYSVRFGAVVLQCCIPTGNRFIL